MERDELTKMIDALDLPRVTREDLKRDYANYHSEPKMIETKKMMKMSSKDGKKAAIILWEDDTVTVISTSKKEEPHISSTNSPEMYYIAQKHYIDLGLQMTYAEENGKEIGKR